MILLELLFPSRCPICDRVQPLGERICPDCLERLPRIQSPFCRKCGRALDREWQEYCDDCMEHSHQYLEGRALYEYPIVRGSIYRMKYRGRAEYGEFYGGELAGHLGRTIRAWNPDVLIPVPLHPARKRRRGYNQAELIARALGKCLHIPVETGLIRRIKNTAPQKTLDPQERQNNLKKAFKMCENDVKLNTIIIVDDIYTTGSTVDAMAAVLQEAGVKNIYFITLAIGRG